MFLEQATVICTYELSNQRLVRWSLRFVALTREKQCGTAIARYKAYMGLVPFFFFLLYVKLREIYMTGLGVWCKEM